MHGDTVVPVRASLMERVLSKLTYDHGCWTWTGGRAGRDRAYGQIFTGSGYGYEYVHRLMYQWASGDPIPNGMAVDHLCRNTLCCNPMHLEVVTNAENTRRGKGRGPKSNPLQEPACGHSYEMIGAERRCKQCRNANRRERAKLAKEKR